MTDCRGLGAGEGGKMWLKMGDTRDRCPVELFGVLSLVVDPGTYT